MQGSQIRRLITVGEAHEVRQSRQEASKFAALAVRELFVLLLCSTRAMSDIGYEAAVEAAYGRHGRALSPELRSQFHLCRSAICRLGRDLAVLEKAAPKIFNTDLTDHEMQALRDIYARVAANQLR